MKAMHISSVVCSPHVTVFGGLLGFRGLEVELSYFARRLTLELPGSFSGSLNVYVVCQLKSQSGTLTTFLVVPSGRLADTFIDFPSRCMWGVTFSTVTSDGMGSLAWI